MDHNAYCFRTMQKDRVERPPAAPMECRSSPGPFSSSVGRIRSNTPVCCIRNWRLRSSRLGAGVSVMVAVIVSMVIDSIRCGCGCDCVVAVVAPLFRKSFWYNPRSEKHRFEAMTIAVATTKDEPAPSAMEAE